MRINRTECYIGSWGSLIMAQLQFNTYFWVWIIFSVLFVIGRHQILKEEDKLK